MKNITLLALAAITLLGLSACNAISGAGQDVSDIGSDVSAGARGVERSIENQ
ncbi:MAG: entericidin [Verrucomicrobia bacterium]|jgi:predicted small secreted protein|nr:entericidin [Verrucomicrobiota bacterium]